MLAVACRPLFNVNEPSARNLGVESATGQVPDAIVARVAGRRKQSGAKGICIMGILSGEDAGGNPAPTGRRFAAALCTNQWNRTGAAATPPRRRTPQNG
jgi:hypothetical protein